jgi:hypothetical protein
VPVCLSVYPSMSVSLPVYPPEFFRFMRRIKSHCCLSPNFFVFYAVRVVSKENKRPVLPRTCFFLLNLSYMQTFFFFKITQLAFIYSIFIHNSSSSVYLQLCWFSSNLLKPIRRFIMVASASKWNVHYSRCISCSCRGDYEEYHFSDMAKC